MRLGPLTFHCGMNPVYQRRSRDEDETLQPVRDIDPTYDALLIA